jgi:BlaI family transcriptional regulator, penicillinase repressor
MIAGNTARTMKKTGLPHPTDSELAILQVLWSYGPSSVRDVHEALSHNRTTGYTTTLKLMQIMAEKGLVTRDESRRTHIYEAAGNPDRTRQQLVRSLLDRAFGGSAKALVMQALSANETSAEELTEIRNLLDSLERNSK